jgi:hypothetical protein
MFWSRLIPRIVDAGFDEVAPSPAAALTRRQLDRLVACRQGMLGGESATRGAGGSPYGICGRIRALRVGRRVIDGTRFIRV